MRAAWVVIAAAFVFASGCAQQDWIDRTLVTVDVTGTWQGTNRGTGTIVQLELEQQGSTVKGFMRLIAGSSQNVAGVRDGPIESTVAGDVFSFRSGRAQGELRVVSEEEMDGTAEFAFGRFPFIFRLVRSPSSSESSQPPR